MSIPSRFIASFAMASAAVAIASAPSAAAADEPHLACTYSSTGNSQCESPGNSQLVATPSDVPYQQQIPYAWVIPGRHSHGRGGSH
jgi:hypothetical protein